MTKSKRVQEDSDEKKHSPKDANDVLTEKDQASEKVEVPTDGNSMLKKEGDNKKEILISPLVSLPFPYIVKSD